MILGASGTPLPCLHHNPSCSIATSSPSTHVLSFNCSRSLHSSLNWPRCSLTQVAGITYSLIQMLSMYAEAAWPTVSSYDSTMLIIAFMMRGATFRPNPKSVKQYLFPSTFMVWNGDSDLWTHTWRYTHLRFSKDTLEPFAFIHTV